MEKNNAFSWHKILSLSIVTLGLGWMLFELLRVVWLVMQSGGIGAVFADGVVLHKIGELMIAAPFILALFLPMFWDIDDNELKEYLKKLRLLMLSGAILNGIAWLSLRSLVDWHLWCLILSGWGMLGFLLIKPLSFSIQKKRQEEIAKKMQ